MELSMSYRSLFNRLPAYRQADNLKWYNALFARGEQFVYDYDRILRIERMSNVSCWTDKLTFELVLRIWNNDVDELWLLHNGAEYIDTLATGFTKRDLKSIELLFSEWDQIPADDRQIILDKIKDQYVKRLKRIKRQLKAKGTK